MTTASMSSPRKKCPFDYDDDQQDPSSTPLPPPKRQKVGDDGGDDSHRDGDADSDHNSDGNDDESEPQPTTEFEDDEPFPLDSKDKKLFKWRTRSDDGGTSFELVESVGYHNPDNCDDDDGGSSNDDNDDDATNKFSDEED
jgi:hypothetical protein